MKKSKTTMIEITDNELWYIYTGLALLKDADKVMTKKRRQKALSLTQKIYKIGILVFKWERK